MATYMTSGVLYQQTLDSYQKSMSKYGSIPLAQYCKKHRVNYGGMKRWMSDKNISILDLRRSYSQDYWSSTPIPISSIVPICITNTDPPKVSPEYSIVETISKIKIIYPTGVVIEVEEISYTSLKDLLSLSIH